MGEGGPRGGRASEFGHDTCNDFRVSIILENVVILALRGWGLRGTLEWHHGKARSGNALLYGKFVVGRVSLKVTQKSGS